MLSSARRVMRLDLAVLLVGLLSVAACADPGPETTVTAHTVTVNGTQRQYLLYTEGLDVTTSRPLLLLYHGAGGNALDMLNATGIATRARDAGMAVASLDAVAGYGGLWATNPVDLPIADDVQFTRAAVDDIATRVAVDRKRIYAVGMSRGGDFVYQLACRAGDLVRGVAAVAATMLYTSREWCDAPDQSPFPPAVAIAVGTEDPLMPWNGGLAKRMGAPETTDYWAARYACSTPPTEHVDVILNSATYTKSQYACAGTSLRLYKMEPLAHVWPGAYIENDLLAWFLTLPAR